MMILNLADISFSCSDECVSFPIQKGIDASRSKVFYFKHNDVKDLERLLMEQDVIDRKNPKKAANIRRFIIVEAIYMNTGQMCPLPQIVELRKRYKLRLILDESVSFGAVGHHGRGLTEHLNVNVSFCSIEIIFLFPNIFNRINIYMLFEFIKMELFRILARRGRLDLLDIGKFHWINWWIFGWQHIYR